MTLPSPARTHNLSPDTDGHTTLLQPEEEGRLQRPPRRCVTFDLNSSVDTRKLITMNRQVKADGGTLPVIVLSVEPSMLPQNQPFDTALIAGSLEDVFHEVRDTPSQLVHLDLAKIDSMLSTAEATTLPYPKAEARVERLLFDPLSKEHQRCVSNLAKLDGEKINFTIMSHMASKFMGRKQNYKHPGWFRHKDISPNGFTLAGLNLNKSNLALLRHFGVKESLLLPAAVKHNLFASGIASPSPGTALHVKWGLPSQDRHRDHDATQSGLLEGMGSTVSMAGYTRPQLQRGQAVGATGQRKRSVAYLSLGLQESPCATTAAQYQKGYWKATYKPHGVQGGSTSKKASLQPAITRKPRPSVSRREQPYEVERRRVTAANKAAGLTGNGNERKFPRNDCPNPCCLSCGAKESYQWHAGCTLCNKCQRKNHRHKKKAEQDKKQCKKAHKAPQ